MTKIAMTIVVERKQPASSPRQRTGRHLSQPWVRSSLVKWLIVGSVTVIDALWITFGGFHVVAAGAIQVLILVSLTGAAAWICLLTFNNVGAFVFSDTVAFVIAFAASGSILSYLAMSTDFPLVDRYLSAADHAIGFDWLSYFEWMRAHSSIGWPLHLIYLCWTPEWVAIPFLLAYRHEKRVRELTSLGVISALATTIISGLLPAVSAFPYYFPDPGMQLGWVKDILALRDGSSRSIDLKNLNGLVSIPSFHTIGAILFIYVLRGRKILFPIGLALNVSIIVSTISAGSHYLVDVLGGAVVAVLTIAGYRGCLRLRTPAGRRSVKDSACG
jgi:membrane-associated phospholipid phosphatase